MRASFTRAVRYWVTAECTSPLRTGSADGSIDLVLLTHTGRVMLQASSIVGAIRAWYDKQSNGQSKALFGSPEQESPLRVSDALFRDKDEMVTRPRVRMSGATSTVDESAKFDIACLPTGAVCEFELCWRGDSNDRVLAAARDIEACLSAIDQGNILFGAQKSNGFGRMKLTVERRIYDLFNPADRAAWLDDARDGEIITLGEATSGCVIFDVRMLTDTMLVKAAVQLRETDGESPVTVHMEENGKPLLPGSSIKGSVRAHMKRIVPFVHVPPETLDTLMGRDERAGGDGGIAGKLLFSDGELIEPQKTVRQARVHINRLTSGVIRKALVMEQPVGGIWRWQVQAPTKEPAGCLLLLYALRDLGLGIYQLGGTKAIGRGVAREIEIVVRAEHKEAFLRVADGQVTLEDAHGLFASWEAQSGGGRHEA